MASISLDGPTSPNLGQTVRYDGLVISDVPLIPNVNNIIGVYVDDLFVQRPQLMSDNSFSFHITWNQPGVHALKVVWQGPPTIRANGTIDYAYDCTVTPLPLPPTVSGVLPSWERLVAQLCSSKYVFPIRDTDTSKRTKYACEIDVTTLSPTYVSLPGASNLTMTGNGELWSLYVGGSPNSPVYLRRSSPEGVLVQQWQLNGTEATWTLVGIVTLPSNAVVGCWHKNPIGTEDYGRTHRFFFSYITPPYTSAPVVSEIDFGGGKDGNVGVGNAVLTIHPDGSVWAFQKTDGGTSIRVVHVSEVAGALVIDWAEPDFIGKQDTEYYAAHGENPIFAIYPWQNKLLLGYVTHYPIKLTTSQLLAQPCVGIIDSDRAIPREYLKLDRSAIDVWSERVHPVVPCIIDGELWMFTSHMVGTQMVPDLIRWDNTVQDWGVPISPMTNTNGFAVSLPGLGWVIWSVDDVPYIVYNLTRGMAYQYWDGYWVVH